MGPRLSGAVRISISPLFRTTFDGLVGDGGSRSSLQASRKIRCPIDSWPICPIGIGNMTVVSRSGVSMLSRILASSTRPAVVSSRPSVLLRASANSRRQSSSGDGTPSRLNPLVGNYGPPQQVKPTSTPRVATESPAPSRSSAWDRFSGPSSAISPPNADLPPPPPPLPLADEAPVSPSWNSKPESVTTGHAYNALSSGKTGRLDIASIVGAKASEYAAEAALSVTNPIDQPRVHTKAVSGRTVFIKPNISPTSAPNPAGALRVLDKMCRDQKIRQKYHSQKFHERKGLRKKRLKSLRWRMRFKAGFQATVSRVLALKAQGW